MSRPSEVLAKKARQIERIIQENPSAFDFLLVDVPELIRKRTRLGKGVSTTGGPLEPLKKRKPNTRYEQLRKSANLSSETTPGRSNLTASGQLLESIVGERSQASFRFFFRDSRKPGIDGRSSSSTNSQIARGQREQGRPFFFLSKTEIGLLSRKIRDEITSRISGLFK
jgi:hypothetical protein